MSKRKTKDKFTESQRSEIMRAVKSAGGKSTELKFIELCKKNDIKGWRRKYKIFGKPDFVFPAKRVAVFVDGCFWHGHGCRNIRPYNNAEYWEKKIQRNKERDKLVTKELRKKGWRVIRIWECELKGSKLPKTMERLKSKNAN